MTIPLPGTMINNGTELRQLWSGLMGPDGFAARRLWLVFLDDAQRVLPLVLPIDELPEQPTVHDLASLARAITSIKAEVGAASVAMLLSRPGPGAMTDADRQWVKAVREACGHLDWPVHLATEGCVCPFAPDDLV